jgi:AraC family transcriptional regulator
MLTDTQADHVWLRLKASLQEHDASHEAQAICHEWKWRQREHRPSGAIEDIMISRWTDLSNGFLREEATTPPDRYFVGVALKTTRIRLTGGRRTVFDGVMPAGTMYVSGPSKQLSAQFDAPFDFLHFDISAKYFSVERSARFISTEALNDLVLLRNSFAEQLAKTLTGNPETTDRKFARCVGQTLAMHIARLEPRRNKVHALPKWRLNRVEEYVNANFHRHISLSDLAKVAGLSRMHFAAQFRTATGYRPREFLLRERIEHAKLLLSASETRLADIALTVGFGTQAHFSTVFKRLTGDTPARWRCMSKNHLPAI